MTDTEFIKMLTECLPTEILDRDGQTLYSGIDTLRRGKFYFIGFNPAADGTNHPLRKVRLHDNNWSAFTSQCWMCEGKCDPQTCSRTGEAKHQRNVQRTMCELAAKPEETFATNLIFVESRNIRQLKKELKAADFPFDACVKACWRVHQKMLAVVRPQYIVCFGNGDTDSAYSLVRKRADSKVDYRSEFTSDDPRYRKKFDGKFDLGDGQTLEAMVVGVKHPSYPMSPRGLRAFIGC